MDIRIKITITADLEGRCLTSNDEIRRLIAEQLSFWDSCPLPFVDVDDDELVFEMGIRKPRVEVGYLRHYGVDTNFNVLKASIMHAERVKYRSRLMFRDLSPLLKMPLEIFLEIIEYLHPLDLYHLSKTGDTMRDLIQRHDTIWATSWNTHRIPLCPPGFSYPQWADLLFGPAICDACGIYAAFPDFVHLKRYCTSCMVFWCQWDELENPALRALVPASGRRLGWVLHKPNSSALRSGREMQRIQDTMENLHKFRRSLNYEEEEAAENAFLDFIAKALKEAIAVTRHADSCQRWVFNLFLGLVEDHQNKQRKALEKFKRHLLASSEGFKPVDLECLEQELDIMWYTFTLQDLKRRSFNRCLQRLLAAARSQKAKRLIAERVDLRRRRYQSLWLAYKKLLRTLSPRLWRCYPPTEVFWTMGACKEAINDEGDEDIGEQKAREIVERLAREGVFQKWFENVKREVEALVPVVEGEPGPDKMKLATSVFRCSACWEHYRSYDSSHPGLVMFGWDEVKDHLHCKHIRTHFVGHRPRGPPPRPLASSSDGDIFNTNSSDVADDANHTSQGNEMPFTPTRIRYDQFASEVVNRILESLDLPADVTTVEELDELDKRFVFEEQGESDPVHTDSEGREVMTWRELVSAVLEHLLQASVAQINQESSSNSDSSSKTTPTWVLIDDIRWTVLTPSETKLVKAEEAVQVRTYDPRVLDDAWSCARCGHFLRALSTQEVVVQHLRTQHEISRPNLVQDVVYLPNEERTPRQRVLLPPLRTPSQSE